MRISILNSLCFIFFINISSCGQHFSVYHSVEELFSLEDEVFFKEDENLLLELENSLLEIDTLGIVLRAPALVNSENQEILPLLVAIKSSGERGWEHPVRQSCYIVATNLSDGTVIFDKLFYDRKEKKSFEYNEREVKPPNGLAGPTAIVKIVDIKEVLNLSMTKGEWSFSIIYHDWVSNRVKVKIEGIDVHEVEMSKGVQFRVSETQIYPSYSPSQHSPILPENGLNFSCNYYKSDKKDSLIFIGSYNIDAKDYHFVDEEYPLFQDDQKLFAIVPLTLLLLPRNSEYHFYYNYYLLIYNNSDKLSRSKLQGYFTLNVLRDFEDVTIPNDTYLAYMVIDANVFGPKEIIIE